MVTNNGDNSPVNVTFNFNSPVAVPVGQFVTATATRMVDSILGNLTLVAGGSQDLGIDLASDGATANVRKYSIIARLMSSRSNGESDNPYSCESPIVNSPCAVCDNNT